MNLQPLKVKTGPLPPRRCGELAQGDAAPVKSSTGMVDLQDAIRNNDLRDAEMQEDWKGSMAALSLLRYARFGRASPARSQALHIDCTQAHRLATIYGIADSVWSPSPKSVHCPSMPVKYNDTC